MIEQVLLIQSSGYLVFHEEKSIVTRHKV